MGDASSSSRQPATSSGAQSYPYPETPAQESPAQESPAQGNPAALRHAHPAPGQLFMTSWLHVPLGQGRWMSMPSSNRRVVIFRGCQVARGFWRSCPGKCTPCPIMLRKPTISFRMAVTARQARCSAELANPVFMSTLSTLVSPCVPRVFCPGPVALAQGRPASGRPGVGRPGLACRPGAVCRPGSVCRPVMVRPSGCGAVRPDFPGCPGLMCRPAAGCRGTRGCGGRPCQHCQHWYLLRSVPGTGRPARVSCRQASPCGTAGPVDGAAAERARLTGPVRACSIQA